MAYNREFIAYRTDKNQASIVKAFRQLGYSVALTHAAGNGIPDLIVSKGWFNVLVEVKDGEKQPSARKFTDKQEVFWFSWQGLKAVAARTEDVLMIDHYVKDVLAAVGAAGIAPFIEGNRDPIYKAKLHP